MEKSFSAYEFHEDETFHKAQYCFQGSTESGWVIFRNEKQIESLGPGYVLLKTIFCGICATDIARANLPFPLPQVTGHEIIALYQDKPVAIDINASHIARGVDHSDCYYCEQLMPTHCSSRLTLGIDRLPGGFSPYILAPVNAIYPLPEQIDPKLMVVTEPFAAALHAVESMQIEDGMKIAIVGPKRLGLLLIMALSFYRKKCRTKFSISAVIRHSDLAKACILFGSDEVLLASELGAPMFDIVFDTSGSKSGFELSMAIAKHAVHIKSTHGLAVSGLEGLTELVINEMSLYPMLEERFDYIEKSLSDKNKHCILLDSGIPEAIKSWIESNSKNKSLTVCDLNQLSTEAMELLLTDKEFKGFDVALVSSLDNLNKLIAFPGIGNIMRAKSDVHWYGGLSRPFGVWAEFFEKNLYLCSSRCGDFARAINLIEENAEFFSKLIPHYLSGSYKVEQINEAFDQARSDVKSIKLVINH